MADVQKIQAFEICDRFRRTSRTHERIDVLRRTGKEPDIML